ncbi:MAG: glycoside hydrolase family 36 protein [Bacteroidota bacterium]
MPLQLSKVLLRFNDREVELPLGKMSSFEELYVDFTIEQVAGGEQCRLTIHPKQDIVLQGLELYYPYTYQSTDRLFANGFQSWSESREYGSEERIPTLRGFTRSRYQYFGDTHLPGIRRGRGHLHSWTYSYIRRDRQFDFIGSLSEQTGFTLLHHDTQAGQLCLSKECAGLQLSHSFPLLNCWSGSGSEAEVFDRYFEAMGCPPPKAAPMTGWTSWYNYYTDISEEIILNNLAAFEEKEVPADIIQIDDGYQQEVGDWLKIKSSFPNGMGAVAKKIKAAGYKAGIWIAPFVCSEHSQIFKEKKSWLLKDRNGKPVKVGHIPVWKGWFYALDFYNPAVQEYLTGVLFTFLNKWGYDLLKLDFLYAVCILPRPHKTRGQIMHEAMQFLRERIGDKLTLGCGVPLGSAFGQVDYCRIGTDIHLEWEQRWLRFLNHRERVSTSSALQSVIGRRQLNGRAFINDPDVFILRRQNNQLSEHQQFTILLINCLLGDLLFTSDYLAAYQAEQWSELMSIFKWRKRTLKHIQTFGKNGWAIHFSHQNKHYIAACNLDKQAANFQQAQKTISLEPYESMVLLA